MAPAESEKRDWEGDVNDAAREEWMDTTTAFDRVAQTAEVTTEPQSAATIAERAAVSEPTARKHLESLVESGHVRGIQTDRGTEYVRSAQSLAMDRIAAIHREHTKDDIVAAIEDLESELRDLRETYGVTGVESVVTDFEEDERWRDVQRWRQIEENLDVARAALQLYDFDPDGSRQISTTGPDGGDGGDGAGGDETDRGAFGRDGSRRVA